MVEQGIKSEKYIFAAFEDPEDDTAYYDCLVIKGNKLYVKNGNPSLHMIHFPDEKAFDECTEIGEINNYHEFSGYLGEALSEEDIQSMFSSIKLNLDGAAYLLNILSHDKFLEVLRDNIDHFKEISRRSRTNTLRYRKLETGIKHMQDESPKVKEMTYVITQYTDNNCR